MRERGSEKTRKREDVKTGGGKSFESGFLLSNDPFRSYGAKESRLKRLLRFAEGALGSQSRVTPSRFPVFPFSRFHIFALTPNL